MVASIFGEADNNEVVRDSENIRNVAEGVVNCPLEFVLGARDSKGEAVKTETAEGRVEGREVSTLLIKPEILVA